MDSGLYAGALSLRTCRHNADTMQAQCRHNADNMTFQTMLQTIFQMMFQFLFFTSLFG
ncbi:MAG: hypothetical protein AB1847_18370 [bacterium]